MDKKKFGSLLLSKKKIGSQKKPSFEFFFKRGPKGGISIIMENGPLGCYL